MIGKLFKNWKGTNQACKVSLIGRQDLFFMIDDLPMIFLFCSSLTNSKFECPKHRTWY
jgi:hypothetical protein